MRCLKRPSSILPTHYKLCIVTPAMAWSHSAVNLKSTEPRYNLILTARPNDSTEYLASTPSNVIQVSWKVRRGETCHSRVHSDHFQLCCCTGWSPLPIGRFLTPRAASTTLPVEHNLNRFEGLKGLVQRIKISSYCLTYYTTLTWPFQAELSYCSWWKAAVEVKAVRWQGDLPRFWKTQIHHIKPPWITLGKSLASCPLYSYLLHGANRHHATLQKYKGRLRMVMGVVCVKYIFPHEIFAS